METKFKWLIQNKKLPQKQLDFLINNDYITEHGIEFSDAFVAINSSTTRDGNSLIAPLEVIRKHGLIPKTMLPAESSMTFDQYHDPNRITQEMRDLGLTFLDHFTINYERVEKSQYLELLEKDIFSTGGYAWPSPINNEYPSVSYQPNHAFMVYKKPPYFIFDNYIDSIDGDFIKKLTQDYKLLDFGYRLIISLKKKESAKGFWSILFAILGVIGVWNDKQKSGKIKV